MLYQVWDTEDEDHKLTKEAVNEEHAAELVAEEWHGEMDYFTEFTFAVQGQPLGETCLVKVTVESCPVFTGKKC